MRAKTRRRLLGTAFGTVALAGAAGAAWLASLPSPDDDAEAPAIDPRETEALLAALAPPKRQRPLIAVVGINDATEATDYLMPTGVLRRAGVADVSLLATHPGPVTLFPALTVEPDDTTAAFDARHPDGADYVIVPAMSRDDDPAVLSWIARQAAGGATSIGVCAGAKVVAAAGLLDGARATTHWYYRKELLDKHPRIEYVADRRLVADGRVVTTTGISASMPVALVLVEAIAGRAAAERAAAEVGLSSWDARHASRRFQFTRPFALAALTNALAFWKRERLGLELREGVDEVTLALVADAWSRTYRSRAVTWTRTGGLTRSRNGVGIHPDRIVARWPAKRQVPDTAGKPAAALDATLDAITARYGARTAAFVAMQLEYPWHARDRRPATP